ncbi:MAG: hypothetical protein QM726_11540 [Chitinophagaceae bacterium]
MAKAAKPAPKKKAVPKKKVAVKKATPAKKKAIPVNKKAATKESALGIKYSDKSAGQPQLVPIFDALKKLLLPYGKGSIKVKGGSGGEMALVSDKPIEIKGKVRNEYWFAGLLVQQGYVGFYFMPAKTKEEIKEVFAPELLKCLKGKSCFHIKANDPKLFQQVKESLAKGHAMQLARGWID